MLTKALFWAGGLYSEGLRACWLLRSVRDMDHSMYMTWKNRPMMPKIVHSLAWLQAVRMLYSDFYTSCWYLDIFTSTMFTFFLLLLFFLYKSWLCRLRLKEGCLRKGCLSKPAVPQSFWVNHLAPVACLWSWFWDWAPLTHRQWASSLWEDPHHSYSSLWTTHPWRFVGYI